jgi:sodium/hydrogen exchanger-like protein 6/7
MVLTEVGIVSLLFCGITMKHYAYYNMSRRTQLTTKFTFQLLAQLSENFIFIYLGLTLFTDTDLVFQPLFILMTVVGICVARYAAVFPLSKLINWTIRVRARRRNQEVSDELPHSYQVMLFWAGLRGAVGVALAADLQKTKHVKALQMTVLLVVVLTVIIFGGTTARMLEIMGIKTGVVEEVDSDDEFDIETTSNGTYYKRSGAAFGHTPIRPEFPYPLGKVDARANGGTSAKGGDTWENGYSSGSNNTREPRRPGIKTTGRQSSQGAKDRDRDLANSALLSSTSLSPTDPDADLWSDSDLPPAAPRRSPKRRPSPPPNEPSRSGSASYPTSGSTDRAGQPESHNITATGAIRDFFTSADDPASWFKKLDEAVIKPTLLLDQSAKAQGSGSGSHGGV